MIKKMKHYIKRLFLFLWRRRASLFPVLVALLLGPEESFCAPEVNKPQEAALSEESEEGDLMPNRNEAGPSSVRQGVDSRSTPGAEDMCGTSQPPQAPEPLPPAEPQAPDLSHTLLDDNTRRAELDERAGFHFVGLSEEKKEKVLLTQVKIERAIEKALLSDGYSRDELSQRGKRDEIRGFLFYRNGKLLSMKTYDLYVKEVQFGTHRSRPYQVIIDAISSSNLFLTKVKKIKRWEPCNYPRREG